MVFCFLSFSPFLRLNSIIKMPIQFNRSIVIGYSDCCDIRRPGLSCGAFVSAMYPDQSDKLKPNARPIASVLSNHRNYEEFANNLAENVGQNPHRKQLLRKQTGRS